MNKSLLLKATNHLFNMWGNIIVIYLIISTVIFIPIIRYLDSHNKNNFIEFLLILLAFIICFPQVIIIHWVRSYYDSDNEGNDNRGSLDDFSIKEIENYLRAKKIEKLKNK